MNEKTTVNLILEIILIKLRQLRETKFNSASIDLDDSIYETPLPIESYRWKFMKPSHDKENKFIKEFTLEEKCENFERLLEILINLTPEDLVREIKLLLLNEFERTNIEIQSYLENHKNKSRSNVYTWISQSILYILSKINYNLEFYVVTLNSLVNKLNENLYKYYEEEKYRNSKDFRLIDKFIKLKKNFIIDSSQNDLNELKNNTVLTKSSSFKQSKFSFNKFYSFGRFFFSNCLWLIQSESKVSNNIIGNTEKDSFYKNLLNKNLKPIKKQLILRISEIFPRKSFIDSCLKAYFTFKLANWNYTSIKSENISLKSEICRICENSYSISDFILHIFFCKDQRLYSQRFSEVNKDLEISMDKLKIINSKIISRVEINKEKDYYFSPLKDLTHKLQVYIDQTPKLKSKNFISKKQSETAEIQLLSTLIEAISEEKEVYLDDYEKNSYKINRLISIIQLVLIFKKGANDKELSIIELKDIFRFLFRGLYRKLMTIERLFELKHNKSRAKMKIKNFYIKSQSSISFNSGEESLNFNAGSMTIYQSPYNELPKNNTLKYDDSKSKLQSLTNNYKNNNQIQTMKYSLPKKKESPKYNPFIKIKGDNRDNYNSGIIGYGVSTNVKNYKIRSNKIKEIGKKLKILDLNTISVNPKKDNVQTDKSNSTSIGINSNVNFNTPANSLKSGTNELGIITSYSITNLYSKNNKKSLFANNENITDNIGLSNNISLNSLDKLHSKVNIIENITVDDDTDDYMGDNNEDKAGIIHKYEVSVTDYNNNFDDSCLDFDCIKYQECTIKRSDTNINHNTYDLYQDVSATSNLKIEIGNENDEDFEVIEIIDLLEEINIADKEMTIIHDVYEQDSSEISICENFISNKQMKISDFKFITEIAKGGYGRVDLYKKTSTGDIYAIKTKTRNETSLLKNETLIFNEIYSDYVVKCFGMFSDNSNYYYIMEYMRGGNLLDLLNKYALPNQFIVAEIILALEYLHSIDIIYRDLKPENIVISYEGHFKLTDFGISEIGLKQNKYAIYNFDSEKKFKEQTNNFSMMKNPKKILGTEQYLAPEVIRDQSLTSQVDYWSLGVLIYELYTNKFPFQGENFSKTSENILNCKINWDPMLSLGHSSHLSNLNINEAKDLISKFLVEETEKRWGSWNLNSIKNHKFFDRFDWENIKSVDDVIIKKHVLDHIKFTNSKIKEARTCCSGLNLDLNKTIEIGLVQDPEMTSIYDNEKLLNSQRLDNLYLICQEVVKKNFKNNNIKREMEDRFTNMMNEFNN